MPNTITPLAYSLEDAAKQLSVSAQSIRRLIDRGELKARHVGTRVLVPRTELERFLTPTDQRRPK
jgi:excisionase family DNA binding protein